MISIPIKTVLVKTNLKHLHPIPAKVFRPQRSVCLVAIIAKSQRDAPTPPRYAMSGFYIEMGGPIDAAAIDARHRAGHR